MQQKMLSLLPTRISLLPILACVSWLYKPRKTGQLPKNVGESLLRRCMLIDINSIHPARTMQEVYELIVFQKSLSAFFRGRALPRSSSFLLVAVCLLYTGLATCQS